MKVLTLLLALASLCRADIYELRTYTTHEGRMDDLIERFQNHTLAIFEKHGIKNVGYWVSEATDEKPSQLIYIVAHKDRDAAKASWAAFGKDPDWRAAFETSTENGRLVKKVESVYLTPTEFSKMQ